MQSWWDYLRVRTRNAVLAGVQEAHEIIEAGTSPDVEEAADRFLTRHGHESKLPSRLAPESHAASGQGTAVMAPGQVPFAEVADEFIQAEVTPAPITQPNTRVSLAAQITARMIGDEPPLDPFQQRLQQTNPALNPQPNPARRKRGRPRKNP
ncbi:MAG: hypothetical protein U0790_02125 [Isosphaeraceae bacterium]